MIQVCHNQAVKGIKWYYKLHQKYWAVILTGSIQQPLSHITQNAKGPSTYTNIIIRVYKIIKKQEVNWNNLLNMHDKK